MSLNSAPKGQLCRILSVERTDAARKYRILGLRPGAFVRVICHHPSLPDPRLVEVEIGDSTVSLPSTIARGVKVKSVIAS